MSGDMESSGSHKCLRFGLWPTLCTLKDFIYLLNLHLSHCWLS